MYVAYNNANFTNYDRSTKHKSCDKIELYVRKRNLLQSRRKTAVTEERQMGHSCPCASTWDTHDAQKCWCPHGTSAVRASWVCMRQTSQRFWSYLLMHILMRLSFMILFRFYARRLARQWLSRLLDYPLWFFVGVWGSKHIRASGLNPFTADPVTALHFVILV